MPAVLAPHRQSEIRQLVEAALRPSRFRGLLTRDLSGGVGVSVALGVVSLGDWNPKRAWRRWTRKPRFFEAARLWLTPDSTGLISRAPQLQALPEIRRRVCLEHYHDEDFARELRRACADVREKHPGLADWVDCRSALLDFVINPPGQVPRQLVETGHLLDNALTRMIHFRATGDMAEAATIADGLIAHSLDAVRAACCCILSPEREDQETDCSVNLMLPIPKEGLQPLPSMAGNWSTAEELWAGVEFDNRLVVLSETPTGVAARSHKGFWAPIPRLVQRPLPGAMTAVCERRANAVFTDDLPEVNGHAAGLDARWKRYMTEVFDKRLFISFPSIMPDPAGVRQVLAVINVNVTPPPDDRTWRRAYHDVWLTAATSAVSVFARFAYWGTLVRMEAEQRHLSAGILPVCRDSPTRPQLGTQQLLPPSD